MSDFTKKELQQFEDMAEEGSYDAEVYKAFASNHGMEYTNVENVDEAYQGQWDSDEDFAQGMADDLGLINKEVSWPYTCIDWEHASNELMYDYFEMNGYYFRSL